jgi:hypothetical protein
MHVILTTSEAEMKRIMILRTPQAKKKSVNGTIISVSKPGIVKRLRLVDRTQLSALFTPRRRQVKVIKERLYSGERKRFGTKHTGL